MNAAVLRCSRPSAVVFHPVAVHTHSSTEMWRVSLLLGHFQTDDRGQRLWRTMEIFVINVIIQGCLAAERDQTMFKSLQCFNSG